MTAPISAQQLYVFATLARHLNMGKAARELHVTASALSHSLRTLEVDLGCSLFERGAGGMKLTPIGLVLLPDTELLLKQMQALRERVREEPSRVQSTLRIAASPTACHYLLPNVLREFVESFRTLQISMEPCSVSEAVERVQQDDADFAVCTEPEHSTGLTAIPIGKDELRFLVPPAHPWTHRNQARDIQSQALIAPDRHSDTYKLICEHFRKEKLELQPRIETSSEEAIKQFVRLGIGIGILPEWTARTELEAGSLCSISLGRKRLTRTWVVLHPKQHRLTLAESLFTDLCRSVARELMEQPGEKSGPCSAKTSVKNGH